MSRKVRSIKGEEVDFDLFDIKQQIESSPKTEEVLLRERYIDVKRRRTTRKDYSQILAEQQQNKTNVRQALERSKAQKLAQAEVEAEQAQEDANATTEQVVTEDVTVEEKPTSKKKRKIVKKTSE